MVMAEAVVLRFQIGTGQQGDSQENVCKEKICASMSSFSFALHNFVRMQLFSIFPDDNT